MHIEGILINKTPYKERDIICHMLLRSGRTLALYVYGGQGGGKKSKGSILELGHMLACELSPRRKNLDSEIQIVKEYKLLWNPNHIRNDFKAFYLMSFFLEFIGKISVEEDLDLPANEHEGLFNVLSNALFYMDKACEQKQFDSYIHLFIFLAKLSIQLGITPDTESCLFCGVGLQENMCLFTPQDGGFACSDCSSSKDVFLSENRLLLEEYQSSNTLRQSLELSFRMPYKEFEKIKNLPPGLVFALFQYINYQFGFSTDQFKSWEMVSSY